MIGVKLIKIKENVYQLIVLIEICIPIVKVIAIHRKKVLILEIVLVVNVLNSLEGWVQIRMNIKNNQEKSILNLIKVLKEC